MKRTICIMAILTAGAAAYATNLLVVNTGTNSATYYLYIAGNE